MPHLHSVSVDANPLSTGQCAPCRRLFISQNAISCEIKKPLANSKGRNHRGTTFFVCASAHTSLANNAGLRENLAPHPNSLRLFSLPVQKLPSAFAFPDCLSASGLSSLAARHAYSSFSTPFSYHTYV